MVSCPLSDFHFNCFFILGLALAEQSFLEVAEFECLSMTSGHMTAFHLLYTCSVTASDHNQQTAQNSHHSLKCFFPSAMRSLNSQGDN